MKYKELYTATKGVFAVMKTTNADLYTTLFDTTESSVLDAWAFFIGSEKTLLPTITTDNAETVLQAVFYNFAESWKRAYKALTADYDVLKPNSTTETTKGTDTTDVVGTVTDTGSDKAFNSTDFVSKDKNEKATDTNNARNYDITKTTIKGTDSAQAQIASEVAMRSRLQVLKVVTTEILNNITLSVYE